MNDILGSKYTWLHYYQVST